MNIEKQAKDKKNKSTTGETVINVFHILLCSCHREFVIWKKSFGVVSELQFFKGHRERKEL